jgi:hypothetical protein
MTRVGWVKMLQIGIIAMVSTLRLDGPGKWSLKRRFWREIIVEKDKIEFQSIPECQENTLAVFGSSGGIKVQE